MKNIVTLFVCFMCLNSLGFSCDGEEPEDAFVNKLKSTNLDPRTAHYAMNELFRIYSSDEKKQGRLYSIAELCVAQAKLNNQYKAEIVISVGDKLLRLGFENPECALPAHKCFKLVYDLTTPMDDRWYAALIFAMQNERRYPLLCDKALFPWNKIRKQLWNTWCDSNHSFYGLAAYTFAIAAMETTPIDWNKAVYVFDYIYEQYDVNHAHWVTSARRSATIYSLGGFGVDQNIPKAIQILKRLRNLSCTSQYIMLTAEIDFLESQQHSDTL